VVLSLQSTYNANVRPLGVVLGPTIAIKIPDSSKFSGHRGALRRTSLVQITPVRRVTSPTRSVYRRDLLSKLGVSPPTRRSKVLCGCPNPAAFRRCLPQGAVLERPTCRPLPSRAFCARRRGSPPGETWPRPSERRGARPRRSAAFEERLSEVGFGEGPFRTCAALGPGAFVQLTCTF
jgi:hypothetical protein